MITGGTITENSEAVITASEASEVCRLASMYYIMNRDHEARYIVDCQPRAVASFSQLISSSRLIPD